MLSAHTALRFSATIARLVPPFCSRIASCSQQHGAPFKYENRTRRVNEAEENAAMVPYAQFCPVAKTAEVFGDRWTPIIMQDLCSGTRAFGELLDAAPLKSLTVRAQRFTGACPVLPESDSQSPKCIPSLRARSGKALPISEIGVLQEQGSELFVRAHHLPYVILDFKAGMHYGPIMSGSDKREKREQILQAFAAQCLP
jgi:hypothetical protein